MTHDYWIPALALVCFVASAYILWDTFKADVSAIIHAVVEAISMGER